MNILLPDESKNIKALKYDWFMNKNRSFHAQPNYFCKYVTKMMNFLTELNLPLYHSLILR